MELVFVYGTLKRGLSNSGLLSDSKFLSIGQTKDKFVMYAAGIPYVSKMFKHSNISGELYSVSESTLYNLDMLEGHPSWYVREKTAIKFIDKNNNIITVDAWLYFNEHVPNNAQLIESGIYGQKKSRFNTLLY